MVKSTKDSAIPVWFSAIAIGGALALGLIAVAAFGYLPLGHVFVAAGLLAAAVLTSAIVLATRSARVPPGLLLVAAAIPWLLGALATSRTIHQLLGNVAIKFANCDFRALGDGAAQASMMRSLGAGITASLLAGCAVGYFLEVLRARRAERWKPLSAAAGALGLMAAAVGTALESHGLETAIRALASMSVSIELANTASAVAWVRAGHLLLVTGWIVAALAVAGFALRLRRLVSGGIAAVALVGIAAFDRAALGEARSYLKNLVAANRAPSGIVLPTGYGHARDRSGMLWADSEGLHAAPDDPPVGWGDGPGLRRLMQGQAARSRYGPERVATVGADARLGGVALHALFTAADEAELEGVALIARSPDAPSDAERARREEIEPFLAAPVVGLSGPRLHLPRVLTSEYRMRPARVIAGEFRDDGLAMPNEWASQRGEGPDVVVIDLPASITVQRLVDASLGVLRAADVVVSPSRPPAEIAATTPTLTDLQH